MPSVLVLFTLFLSSVSMASDIEEPQWRLLATIGDVEVRHYEPSIQAITQLEHDGESARGFRRLAGYIFGGNEQSRSIAMTAPVQETLEQEAPTMAFTMPAQYALDDLPAPQDDSVSLQVVPARTVAVLRFSGWATSGRVAGRRAELLEVLDHHDIDPAGVLALNQYNPPWTLPFLRRNEVAVEIDWPEELASR